MNKREILQQIRDEQAAETRARDVARDIAFFEAFAKNKNLTRAEFFAAYKEPARKKVDVNKLYVRRLIEESGFKSKAPANFDKPPAPEYAKLYAEFANYCKKFPEVKNLVLHGGTGTGKTYAAQIIANNLMNRGFAVLYVTAFGLVERFKKYVQTYGDETQTDALFDCDLLIIDDMGTEPVIRNISNEYLYNVINERLTNEKPFLITTNLNPAALMARYDQRIASRVLSKESSVVIEMKCGDLRLKKIIPHHVLL